MLLSSKTKIIITLGPSCESEDILKNIIFSGARIFRLNTKHNLFEWHKNKILLIKKLSQKLHLPLTTLIDLQGPEIRIGSFPDGKETFTKGEIIYLASEKIKNFKTIILDKEIIKLIEPNQKILIADGNLELKIVKKIKDILRAEVIEGATISGNNNINFPGLKLNLPSISKKDQKFIDLAIKKQVDYVALSFVRDKKDILGLKKIFAKNQSQTKIVSKIETREAIENIDEIIDHSDAIMVARGDLGLQMPLEFVPLYQKMIIKKCLTKGVPVITATQMLESMVRHKNPTRAEVSDIANAIYDGTSAIMLSAETAYGKYPLEAVKIMQKIAFATETNIFFDFPLSVSFRDLNEQLVYAAYKLSENSNIKAIVVFTETGNTARLISKFKSKLPIFAFTSKEIVKNQINFFWGVYPFLLKRKSKVVPIKEAFNFLKENNLLKKKDKVIVLYGDNYGKPGKTNTIKVEEI